MPMYLLSDARPQVGLMLTRLKLPIGIDTSIRLVSDSIATPGSLKWISS